MAEIKIVVDGKSIEVKNEFVLTFCGEHNNDASNNTNPPTYKVDNSELDSAVDFLCRCSGNDFIELVRYAKAHGNKFFHCVKEVSNIANADDVYCTALIKLSRPLSEEVERTAFNLLAEAEKDEYDFVKFWEALQTINYFCESQAS